MDRHSFRAANVDSTSPRYELGKVGFGIMFLKRKNSQRFGVSSFSKFHHTRQKIPFPPLGRPTANKKITLPQVTILNVVLTTQIYQDSSFPPATRSWLIRVRLDSSLVHSCAVSFTQNRRKYTEFARIVPEQSQRGRSSCRTWSVVRSNKPQCNKTEPPSTFFLHLLRSGAVPRPCAPPKDGRKVGGRERIQDSRSIQTRIRNAHLLIKNVLDSCVKLLALLHISSGKGRSADRTSAGSS